MASFDSWVTHSRITHWYIKDRTTEKPAKRETVLQSTTKYHSWNPLGFQCFMLRTALWVLNYCKHPCILSSLHAYFANINVLWPVNTEHSHVSKCSVHIWLCINNLIIIWIHLYLGFMHHKYGTSGNLGIQMDAHISTSFSSSVWIGKMPKCNQNLCLRRLLPFSWGGAWQNSLRLSQP